MNKNKIILGVFVVLLASLFVFLIWHHHQTSSHNSENSSDKSGNPTTISPDISTVKKIGLDFEPKVYGQIQDELYKEGYGRVAESYTFRDGTYLVGTKTGNFPYDDTFRSNFIFWSAITNGKVVNTPLTSGSKLARVVPFGNSAFVKVDGDTLFVAYEYLNQGDKSLNSKGYLYKVNSDGSVTKIYETNDIFDSSYIDKSGTFIFAERQFRDPVGSYPSFMKPYALNLYTYKQGKVVLLKSENHDASVPSN